MWIKLKNKLKQIQESSEAVKKRWLIALSCVSMVIIVFIWLILLNGSIKNAGSNNIKPMGTKTEAEVGFWQTFKTGLKVIKESINK